MKITQKTFLPLLFFVAGLFCVFLCRNSPVGDFGNYYYGSKLLADHYFTSEVYQGPAWFNSRIAGYGEHNFFENYTPVPPFSALFYYPFSFLGSNHAKLIFNLLSLLLFCFALHRLLAFTNRPRSGLYLLPLVFLVPLFINILQGQSYLLICAGFFEIYLASEKKRSLLAALLLSVIISLKVFPVFVLLYFLLRRGYSIVWLTLTFVVALWFFTGLAMSSEIPVYYITNILPRLFNNDVIGAWQPNNQSVHALLLNFFTRDPLANPDPLVDLPLISTLAEAAFLAWVIASCFLTATRSSLFFFSWVIFCMLLSGRYVPAYSLLLLLPFCFSVEQTQQNTTVTALLLFLTGAATYLTWFNPAELTPTFKYARLTILLLLFVLTSFIFALRPPLRMVILVFVPLFVLRFLTSSGKPVTWFQFQNNYGVLFDYRIIADTLLLYCTTGEREHIERFSLRGSASSPSALAVKRNVLFYGSIPLAAGRDHKQKPFIYGDSVVFMSDQNQPPGFYKLRTLPLPKGTAPLKDRQRTWHPYSQ